MSEIDNCAAFVSMGLGYLVRREYACAQMVTKLKAKGASDELAQTVVEQLVKDGSLSDLRYADAQLRSLAQRGHGPLRVRYTLRVKGVPDEVIDECFAQSQHNWIDLAYRALCKKSSPKAVDFSQRRKLQQFLYQRGFSAEHIKAAYNCWSDDVRQVDGE